MAQVHNLLQPQLLGSMRQKDYQEFKACLGNRMGLPPT